MKSRTSFFNLALYKKDVTRFVPLWVIYTVAMLLIMLSANGGSIFYTDFYGGQLNAAEGYARSVNSTIGAMSIMNLIYGLLAAQLLFGELFNTRMCNALHAMPMTREARFGSHLLAGLSFSVAPNLLVSFLMMPNLQNWWYVALLWFAAITLEYLFFFSVAVLAMQCTGNRFAAVLIYGIINFGAMAALWFASVVYLPLMPGVELDWEGFGAFSPVVKMCTLGAFFSVEKAGNTFVFRWGAQWPYLFICAGVGAAVLAGALLLYRRRALESAGDFMAIRALKPVFLVLYTLCVGVFLAMFGTIFDGETYWVFLIAGFIIGFFTGKMLLERSIRVFQRKSFLQLAILVVLMWLSLLATQYDVFYVVRYVPEPDAVKRAEVASYYYGSQKVTISDPEQLALLQKAHGLALQEEECKHGDRQSYEITYRMKDGRTVNRYYTLCRQKESSLTFEKVLASPVAILGIEGSFEDYVRSVTEIEVEGMTRRMLLTKPEQEELLVCIFGDCSGGSMGSGGGAISRFGVTIRRGEKSLYLTIREKSSAFALLEAYDYNDVLEYRDSINTISLDGQVIDEELYGEILMALYEDAKEHPYDGWAVFSNFPDDGTFVLVINEGVPGREEKLHIAEYTRHTYEWIKDYLYKF